MPTPQITSSPNHSALFIGLSTLDTIQLVERLPTTNEKIRALDDMVAAGGPASNAAVACAWCAVQDKLPQPRLVTRISGDMLGPIVCKDLVNQGIEVHSVTPPVGRCTTAASVIVTKSTGDRAVISTGDRTNDSKPTKISDDELADIFNLLNDTSIVQLDGYESDIAIAVASKAKSLGIPVLYDGGSFKSVSDKILALADIAIVSGDFFPPNCKTSDDVFAYLKSAGVSYCAITRGNRPILFQIDGQVKEIEVPRVKAVDTLGAGDFFHGAATYFIAKHGLNENTFRDCLLYAAKVSGLSIQSFGTRDWLREPCLP